MSDKKSFILYNSYYEQVMMLSIEERGQLLTAIYEYQINGEVSVQMSPIVAMAFSFVRSDMQRDAEKYEEKCAKNRANGRKGGRPKKAAVKVNETATEEDVREDELISEGIPSEYIAERQKRAEVYAKRRGVSVTQLLRSWWKSDARGVPPRPKATADDVDDWYQRKIEKRFGIRDCIKSE